MEDHAKVTGQSGSAHNRCFERFVSSDRQLHVSACICCGRFIVACESLEELEKAERAHACPERREVKKPGVVTG